MLFALVRLERCCPLVTFIAFVSVGKVLELDMWSRDLNGVVLFDRLAGRCGRVLVDERGHPGNIEYYSASGRDWFS